MQQVRSFGRRGAVAPILPNAVRSVERFLAPQPESLERAAEPAPVALAEQPTKSVEQEVSEWNEARKVRKRSFREPWRSVSIVAGIAFVLTSWMLPDDVADIAQVALGVLTLGSIYAGWRTKRQPA